MVAMCIWIHHTTNTITNRSSQYFMTKHTAKHQHAPYMTKSCPNMCHFSPNTTNAQPTLPSYQKPTYTMYLPSTHLKIHNYIAKIWQLLNTPLHNQQHDDNHLFLLSTTNIVMHSCLEKKSIWKFTQKQTNKGGWLCADQRDIFLFENMITRD